MKKLIFILLLFSINVQSQDTFLENQKGAVVHVNGKQNLIMLDFDKGKDPEITAYKMLHNAGLIPKKNYTFTCKGEVYTVIYIKDKKLYSFMGLETPL